MRHRVHAMNDPQPETRLNRELRDIWRTIREMRSERRLEASSMAHAFRYAGAQSIPTGSWTQVTAWFDVLTLSEVVDVTAESATTITDDGPYFVGAQLAYVPNGTGRRGVRVLKNGDTTDPIAYAANNADTGGGNSTFVSCFALHRFVVGDVLRVDAYQSSGAALDLSIGASRSNLTLHRVIA